MTDVLTPEQRSRCMAAIRGKNTKPEMIVRSLVHRMGFRFRLHGSKLPGKPDLVFAGPKKVIFVHGCFWHQHPRCKYATRPSTRPDFWRLKLDGNRIRDLKAQKNIKQMGWKILIVWECEIRNNEKLIAKLQKFLSSQ